MASPGLEYSDSERRSACLIFRSGSTLLFGAQVVANAMTETNMNTSNPYEGDRRAGTVGYPLPGVEVTICDAETGEVLPEGEIGQIEVRGPNLFSGHWNLPEKTAEEMRNNGFFKTGDLGFIDADGYIHIVGRSKDMIISGGYNVYPIEIEAEMDALSQVRESAVIGLPHRDFGEAVTAIVVATNDLAIDESSVMILKAMTKPQLFVWSILY